MNEKTNPKISIIIPVYNTELYLRECLDSVINQTLRDIEIILIDDGSTDNSGKICDEYKEKDERITVVHQKKEGVSVARNKGLDIAIGQYIGFVDSDDYIDLDFYEKLYNRAIETNADLVKTQRKNIDYEGNISEGILNRKIINTKNKWHFSYEFTTAIYRRSIIKENNIIFPEGCILSEDGLFLHFVIEKINSLEIINDTYYYYKRRKDSSFSLVLSYEKMFCGLDIYNKILNNANKMYKTKKIDKKTYLLLYKHFINSIKYFFWVDTQENKKLCIEYLITFYNNCLEKKEFKQYLFKQYPIVAKNIIKKNTKNLYNTLSKIQDYDEFKRKNLPRQYKFEIKILKQKLVYLIYLILLKLGIKDIVKKILQNLGYKFNE